MLSIILTYLYTEKTEIPLELAVDVLFAADELFIEKLKTKAAVVIATLGNGVMDQKDKEHEDVPTSRIATAENHMDHSEQNITASDPIDPYLVLRAAWLTRVTRLEQFAARYFAYRLERYLDEEDFTDVIRESAARIEKRQETDSIELLDDIRYYLSERFRLRFEDVGWEEMEEEEARQAQEGDTAAGTDAGVKDISNGTAHEGDLTGRTTNVTTMDVAHLDSQDPPPSSASKLADASGQDRGQAILATNVAAEGEIRTLDGDIAGDEFAADAQNYQILLARIDGLLEKLKLDA